MTMIQMPATPADPQKGVPGTGPLIRWQGSVQAYIDEDIADVIKGHQRMQVSQTIVDLPANVPIWPNEEDLITIVRVGVVARYAPAGPQTEQLLVRKTDGGLLMLGKLRLMVVRS
jgi:hypothetical protein